MSILGELMKEMREGRGRWDRTKVPAPSQDLLSATRLGREAPNKPVIEPSFGRAGPTKRRRVGRFGR